MFITNVMYGVKCKHSNSHTSLTTLCSHFVLSYRPWLKLPTGGHVMWFYMGNLGGGVFSRIEKAVAKPFFPNKEVSGRNGDHEWLRMTNAFILCDLLWKVQQSHAVNREGSFNLTLLNDFTLKIE